MRKFFVASDIHSFYSKFREALKKAGYNPKNRDHILILNGDLWDRGSESLKLFNFVKKLPKSRCILIKGNHEGLLIDLLEKDFPDPYDFSNGTVRTCFHFAKKVYEQNPELADIDEYYFDSLNSLYVFEGYENDSKNKWIQIRDYIKNSEFYKFLTDKRWKDWYELNDKFIITHSFIPLENLDGLPAHFVNHRSFKYKPDWRTSATERELEESRWGCPWRLYRDGYFENEEKNGKILVCGHWHVSDFYHNLANDYNSSYDTKIFKLKGIIAIDCGLVRNIFDFDEFYHPQNILVINENNELFDQDGNRIKDVEIKPVYNTELLKD